MADLIVGVSVFTLSLFLFLILARIEEAIAVIKIMYKMIPKLAVNTNAPVAHEMMIEPSITSLKSVRLFKVSTMFSSFLMLSPKNEAIIPSVARKALKLGSIDPCKNPTTLTAVISLPSFFVSSFFSLLFFIVFTSIVFVLFAYSNWYINR